MANENNPQIVLDGDVSPLRKALREAAADLKRFGDEGSGAFERMTGPLGALQSKFLAVGAILAGGKVFQAAVEESIRLTGETNALSKAMGISTDEAGALNIALGDIYSSAEDFIGASQQLGRQLRTNEDGLNAMGLKTRDANGEYRNMKDLMMDAVKVLGEYREGTDRNLAAQTMFGKGAGEVTKLLKLNNDVIDAAREKQAQLGLVVGVENVAAVKSYKAAMNDAGDVMSAFKKSIGDAVMPVLTKLAEWFAEIGPAAVLVIKGTIGGLVAIFWGLKFAAETVWNGIALVIEKTTINALRFAETAGRALVLDFAGAKEAWDRGGQMIEDVVQKRYDNILAAAEETQTKLWNLFANPETATSGPASGRSYVAPPDKEKQAKAKEATNMAQYEAELAALKNRYEQEHLLRQFGKEEELEYWRELLASYDLTQKDRLAITKRTATLEVEIRRQAAKEQRDLDGVLLESRRTAAQAQVDLESQAAQFERDNGNITKSQLIEQEIEFARRRFEIEYQALLERQQMLKDDPTTSPAALAQNKEQMLAAERNYQLRRNQLGQDKQKQDGSFANIFDDAGNSFARAATAMLTTATTLRAQMANIFGAIYQSFITNLIAKPVGEYLASQARMLAAKMGFLGSEQAANKTASAATVATKGVEETAVVSANAAEAGAGAAASQAAIPVVGPGMALAAMAAVFAAVMALSSKRKSAAGGFDIPHGLNPVTQLHEEEMVLPKHLANPLREMLAGGGQANAGQTHHHHYNVNALDARSFERFAKENSRTFASAVKSAQRDGFK